MNTETERPTKVSKREQELLDNLVDPKKIPLREAINRAIQNHEPIFVMNASDRNGSKQRGGVFIQIDGLSTGLMVPDTFIPVEVTNMFPAKKLAESADFLQAVDVHLTIHDPDECIIYMKSEGAQAEKERLRSQKDRFDNDVNKTMEELKVSVSPKQNDDTDDDPQGFKFSEDANAPVSKYGADRVPDSNATNDREAEGVLWRVFQLVNDPEVGHDKIFAPLRTTPNLSKRDLKYIILRVNNAGVKTWASHKLNNPN